MKLSIPQTESVSFIELTPLVDILMVLLFFNLNTPAVKTENFELPQISGVSQNPTQKNILNIKIRQEKSIQINNILTSPEDLSLVIEQMNLDPNQTQVLITTSAEIPFQEVLQVIEKLNSLSLNQIEFAATKPKNQK